MRAILGAATILLGMTGLAAPAAAAIVYNCAGFHDSHYALVVDPGQMTVTEGEDVTRNGAALTDPEMPGKEFVEITDDHIDWGAVTEDHSESAEAERAKTRAAGGVPGPYPVMKIWSHLDLRTNVLHPNNHAFDGVPVEGADFKFACTRTQ
jgi:hypothetical protein